MKVANEAPDSARASNALVCFAVKEEVGSGLRYRNCDLYVTGMGRRNAAEGIHSALAAGSYQFVLTCGFAGGLNPDLGLGTVLFSEDEALGLSEKLQLLGAVPGQFHCAKRVAITRAEKEELRKTTNADAVEMESSVIRTICKGKNIPSATIRVILDTASDDLPLDFNALMTSFDKVNYPKLVWTILCKPHKILPLWRFQQSTIIAAKKLDAVLCGLFSRRRR